MDLLTKAVTGMQDAVPAEAAKLEYIEKTCFDTAKLFGFGELRTPLLEHTELFERGVGDTTDIVQKEMYTFSDKGGRSLTVRPEITASAVRAAIQNGLIYDALPVKVVELGACCRCEKPQAGRLREFHQFSVEMYGSAAPAADAEVISVAASVLGALGLENVSLEINSIGCPECRARYNQKLREYYSAYTDKICETCKGRLERNPMRLLDCKSDICKEIAAGAPRTLDCLCDDCREHFDSVKKYLDAMGIAYKVNPSIVRGLDYYTRTVFEFLSGDIGSQSAIAAGGRYDGLFRVMGGPDTPAVGFAMGIERVRLVMEAQGIEFPEAEKGMIYFAPMGAAAAVRCMALCKRLRDEGFVAETDLCGRSLKAQMKYADKRGFRYTCVVGDNELETGKVKIKNMETGDITETELDDGVIDTIYDIGISMTLANLDSTLEGFEGMAGLEQLTALDGLGLSGGDDD